MRERSNPGEKKRQKDKPQTQRLSKRVYSFQAAVNFLGCVMQSYSFWSKKILIFGVLTKRSQVWCLMFSRCEAYTYILLSTYTVHSSKNSPRLKQILTLSKPPVLSYIKVASILITCMMFSFVTISLYTKRIRIFSWSNHQFFNTSCRKKLKN